MPTLTLSPGNSLAYEHVAPSDTGKTFVCFNALSGDMSMWTASISEALKAHGHGWLIYNLRGQAGSDYAINEFTEKQIVDDAMALLEEVKPVRPIHVGLSIGGAFALKAHMAGGAGQAEGLVLINTLRKDSPRLNWVNDAVVRVFETGGGDLLKDLYSPLLMNEDWQAENRSAFLGDGGYAPCAPNDQEFMLLKYGPTADWNMNHESLDVPVLIISGLQDRVFFNAEDVAELSACIRRGQRVDLANAGHMIPVERPNELSDAIVNFAAKI